MLELKRFHVLIFEELGRYGAQTRKIWLVIVIRLCRYNKPSVEGRQMYFDFKLETSS